MATAPVRYETKPFDCWPKMKEIRRKHFRHTWEAHDRGDVMIMGIVETYLSLFAGMGDFANPSFGPQFTMMMRNPSEAIKCHEAAAAKGYLLDVCSSMRCHLGQLFRGMSTMNPLGGETKPDFLFTPAPCHSMQKTGQIFARHMGVPYFVIETPYHQTKHAHQYVLDQLQEAIPWMEKVTGREYDDEGLIEAVNNEWDCMAAWSRVNEASMLRPAPVDMRQTHSLRLPLVTMRHKKEVVEYARMVADEVEERGRQGISARGYETARLLHEGIPPFYAIQILRYPASYGAVLVAGGGFHLHRLNEDTMTWENRKTPKEKGFDIRTREDALTALIDLYLPLDEENCYRGFHPHWKTIEYVEATKHYGADGLIIHIDRGCRGMQTGMMEAKLALNRAGIPNTTYESSQADPRDYTESQVRDVWDIFMESLGLRRLSELGVAGDEGDEEGQGMEGYH